MMTTDLYRLSRRLVPEPDGGRRQARRVATVIGRNSDGTYTVDLSGTELHDVPALTDVTVGGFATLLIEPHGPLILGAAEAAHRFPAYQSMEVHDVGEAVFSWPSPVTHIDFGWEGRSSGATTSPAEAVRLQLNGDTGSNYDRRLTVMGSGTFEAGSIQQTEQADIVIGRIGSDVAFRESSWAGTVTVGDRAAVSGQGNWAEGTNTMRTGIGGGLYRIFEPDITSMRVYLLTDDFRFGRIWTRAYS